MLHLRTRFRCREATAASARFQDQEIEVRHWEAVGIRTIKLLDFDGKVLCIKEVARDWSDPFWKYLRTYYDDGCCGETVEYERNIADKTKATLNESEAMANTRDGT